MLDNVAETNRTLYLGEKMNEIITERVNLFEPNVYITVCVEIVGKISANRLTVAIKRAFAANEATISKIVLNGGDAFYEKMPESACKIKTENENKNWIDIVRQNEKIPFAIDKGELVRTFIIPMGNKTQLLIMAHHLVGDGKSIIYFVKDIMNALAEIPLTYKPLTLLERNLPQKNCVQMQNYMLAIARKNGTIDFLHGKIIIICIKNIGRQLRLTYSAKLFLLRKRRE